MADRHKYKEVSIYAQNNNTDIKKLKAAKSEIKRCLNDSSRSIFSMLLSIAGLFDVNIGILSNMFSGATTSRIDYLNRCLNLYNDVIIRLYECMDGTTSSYIPDVTITHELIGTYQGQNKGYIYKAGALKCVYGHI